MCVAASSSALQPSGDEVLGKRDQHLSHSAHLLNALDAHFEVMNKWAQASSETNAISKLNIFIEIGNKYIQFSRIVFIKTFYEIYIKRRNDKQKKDLVGF